MNVVGEYLVCPFDHGHRIIEGRLQKHLFKCSKNYPKNHKVVCIFNATHLLDPLEYKHHLRVCPSSGNVEYGNIQFEEEQEQEVGIIPIESVCTLETNTLNEEDWTGNNPTYNPVVATEHKQIVRSSVGLSKAKRKQFRQRERDRMSALANDNTNSSNKTVVTRLPKPDKPLRRPKNVAKALSCSQSSSVTNDISIKHLISKLKEISVEEKRDSSCEQTITQDEEKENISEEKATNTSTAGKNCETNVLKTDNATEIDVSQDNDSLTRNNVPQNVKKEKETEPRKVLQVTSRADDLRGQVKKISTGRGFTLAYLRLKAEISKKEGKDKSVEDFKSIYGYDENEEDIDVENKSS